MDAKILYENQMKKRKKERRKEEREGEGLRRRKLTSYKTN